MRAQLTLLPALLLSSVAAAAEEFPYVAEIVHEATLVRSGPGENYYPTSRLLHGEQVEVYRHDPHGWCAIRPPEGAFSLVPAEAVKLLSGDDLAEVVGQESAVWVGSSIAAPEEHRWQIHLQPGERVIVLGVRADDSDEESNVWYKIAPPAGEFRWVHRDALKRVNDATQPTPTSPETPVETAADASSEEAPASEIADVLPAPAAAEEIEAPAILAIEPGEAKPLVPTASPAPSDFGSREATPPENSSTTGTEASDKSVTPASFDGPTATAPAEENAPAETPSSPQPSFAEADREIPATPRTPTEPSVQQAVPGQPTTTMSPGEFDAEITSLTIDLTLAVAKDLGQWRLGPLHDRARRLQLHASTENERQRANSLAESLERFEELHQRYRRHTSASLVERAARPQSPK